MNMNTILIEEDMLAIVHRAALAGLPVAGIRYSPLHSTIAVTVIDETAITPVSAICNSLIMTKGVGYYVNFITSGQVDLFARGSRFSVLGKTRAQLNLLEYNGSLYLARKQMINTAELIGVISNHAHYDKIWGLLT